MERSSLAPSDASAVLNGRPATRAPTRERWSWALFDFSQTIFSMNVATLYFSVWLIQDLGASDLQFAAASAVASIMVVVALPVLGALSDARRRRKPWVVGFTILCALACFAMGSLGTTTLPLVGQSVIGGIERAASWHPTVAMLLPVLAAYVVANFAYQATHPFYNAMLPELVPVEEQGRMSGLGIAVGYVGSITGVLMVFPFFTGAMPVLGALPPAVMHTLRATVPFTGHGGRVSTFVPTGMLFLLFAIPLMVFCRDHNPAPRGTPVQWRRAFREVAHTVRDARQHPGALRFILTTLIYQDAIGTIISFMAVYAVKAIGFEKGSEVMLFVVLTVPAVFGSYLAGHLVDRIGPKRTLQTTLMIWIALLIAMIAVPTKAGFWVVGFFLGFNYGGVNSAERPMLLTLIPDVEAGRYFSLLLLSARVAAVAGPIIWGETVGILEPVAGTAVAYRAAVMTVAAMFAIGLAVLRGVPDKSRGRSAAHREPS
ncbi:MAG TPA: MFS transporter [Gemmatimonadaceae bacterium]|nr:MFS transporter [Gemmatimonadaceae bacterium]